jgi:integrase/recombinase XerD
MSAYVASFLEMMIAERGASLNTVSSYKDDLDNYQNFFSTQKDLSKLKEEDIRRYLAHLSSKNYSTSSISRRISCLRQFYDFLFSSGHIDNKPTFSIELPKQASKIPRILDPSEIELLFSVTRDDKTAEGVRLYCMLEIIYATGLRVSELVHLKLSNISINRNTGLVEENIIYVKGKGNKERIVLLNNPAINALNSYLGVRTFFIKGSRESLWLFPSTSSEGVITRQRFGQLLKEIAIRAGINRDKVSPHVIRHSFASHLLDNGADLRVIQELLGHSDISTTQIYTHIQKDKLLAIVEKHHPLAAAEQKE